MFSRIVSDGQTGAAQGAWRAAKACGIGTGGWMPAGFLTAAGPCPELARKFGATESTDTGFERRAESNVYGSDGTLYFTLGWADHPIELILSCLAMNRPYLIVNPTREDALEDVLDWIREHRVNVLNVTGDPESQAPGIGEWVEEFIGAVVHKLNQRD